MYYNKVLRVWVLDTFDYLLLGFLIGSQITSQLKIYLSEKLVMKRLEVFVINKSKLVSENEILPLSLRKKINKIYKIATTRNLQYYEFPIEDYEFSNELYILASNIRILFERLAKFLKERELKIVARFFFKNRRLIIRLSLQKQNIDINYRIVKQGLRTKVAVFTFVIGEAASFILAWLSSAALLITSLTLLSTFLIRNPAQQIKNIKDYAPFKRNIETMLKDKELSEKLQIFFLEGQTPVDKITMKPLDKDSAFKFDFDSKPVENFDEYIKSLMEENFGLIENPNSEQI